MVLPQGYPIVKSGHQYSPLLSAACLSMLLAVQSLSGQSVDDWLLVPVPENWEQTTAAEDLDGLAWYILPIQIPSSWSGKPLLLDIGGH